MDFWESVSLVHNSVVNPLIAINESADCLLILLGISYCWLGDWCSEYWPGP